MPNPIRPWSTTYAPNAPLPHDGRSFAEAILGKHVVDQRSGKTDPQAERKLIEWLAQFSTEHAEKLRRLRREEAAQREADELLWFVAQISTEHQQKWRDRQREIAKEAAARRRYETREREVHVFEADWDPAKHPRGGFPQNRGWFSPTSGPSAGGESGPQAIRDKIAQRNALIDELAGPALPPRSNPEPPPKKLSRIGLQLEYAAELPREILKGLLSGAATGSKAIVNGLATAVKNVATLGLSDSQLELIGVTDEDRANGYDTAVTIATASGEVLIAVGTGGVASALSKGGVVARGAGGVMLIYDTVGNAVGVVLGTYDAVQNGVTLSNGAQVAGGLLGLGANYGAARGFKSSSSLPKGFDPANGFATFRDFKAAFGAAGPGQAWHHIVEQTINSGKFAPEILQNPANLLKLPHGKGSLHARLSGFYSSPPRFTGGLTIREWLSKKSFKEQFEFGIQKIKDFGGSEHLPPNLR